MTIFEINMQNTHFAKSHHIRVIYVEDHAANTPVLPDNTFMTQKIFNQQVQKNFKKQHP